MPCRSQLSQGTPCRHFALPSTVRCLRVTHSGTRRPPTCHDGDPAEGPPAQHSPLGQHKLHALLAGLPIEPYSGLSGFQLLHLVQVTPRANNLPGLDACAPTFAPLDQHLQGGHNALVKVTFISR